jgi:small-conductance mechanosensitive channel
MHQHRVVDLTAQVATGSAEIETLRAALMPQRVEHEAAVAKVSQLQGQLEQEQAAWQELRNQLLQLRGVTVVQEDVTGPTPQAAGESTAATGG